MKDFFMKNADITVLLLLCTAVLFIFTGHYGDILLDVGREVYYPLRILEGKVLYKDLFVIYGPSAYLWNALLYKIFGVNLTILYIAGALCSYGIVAAVYLIAQRFLSKFLSFSVGFFTIATGVCSVSLFNFTFPYSWAMLYGTLLCLWSLFCLLKFKDTEKTKYLFAAAFLSGSAVSCKYDFLLYSLIILLVILKTRDLKIILKSLLSFALIPFVSFGILFLQGLRWCDLINTLRILNVMAHTKSLEYFYRHSGVFFSVQILMYWIIGFLKCILCFGAITAGVRILKKKNEFGVILTVIGIVLTYFLCDPAIFAFLIAALTFFAITGYKTLKNDKSVLLLILSIIALSLKSFWGLTPLNYGNYYCSLVLIGFFVLLYDVIDKNLQKSGAIFILAISLWFLIFNASQLPNLNGKIKSLHGTIYTDKNYAIPINQAINFLNSQDKDKTAVIFPEGLIINLLSEKEQISEDFYNSLIPLYTETFKESELIKYFRIHRPNFILFTNQKMNSYNTGLICRDYGRYFCGYVLENYDFVKTFGKDFKIVIFYDKMLREQ